jgi:hypothetical protein
MAKSQGKSQFIHWLMAAWDHQTVELTHARRDADKAEQTASYYLDQLLEDGEAIKALKECSELCRRDNEARERAHELLSFAVDSESKLAAETKLTAVEVQAH